MDSVQTQTLAIKGNDDAVAYIDFCNGDLCVSVVVEGQQADFHFDPITLKMFAHAYKLHCEELKKGELDEKVVVAEIATTTPHGAMKRKTQKNITGVYNLEKEAKKQIRKKK